MACNTLFGIGNMVTQRPSDKDRKYSLSQAEIAVFDRDIHELILDVETLHDIAKVCGFMKISNRHPSDGCPFHSI